MQLGTISHDSSALRGERALKFLAEASARLNRSLDVEETLSELTRMAVPWLADWCSLELGSDPRHTRQLAVAHVDPEKVKLAYEMRERFPPNPDAPNGVPQVLRTGQPEFVPEIPDALLDASPPEQAKIARQLGLKSYIVVPLKVRDRVLGALTLVTAESKRRLETADLELATDLAARAATALDNARLYAEAREAEQRSRLALEAGRLGTWEWNIAEQKIHWSAAIERMHGIPEGSFDGTFEMYQSDIHPEDKPKLLADVQRLLDSRETEHHLLYRIVRPDGEVRWLEAFGHLSRDARGKPLVLRGVCGDVTERRAGEARERQLEVERRAHLQYAARTAVIEALSSDGDDREVLQRAAEALKTGLRLERVVIWLADPKTGEVELRGRAGAPGPDRTKRAIDDGIIGKVIASRTPYRSESPGSDPYQAELQIPPAARMYALFPLVVQSEALGVLSFSSAESGEATFAAMALLCDTVAQAMARRRAQAELRAFAKELERSNADLQQFAYVASHDLQEPLRMVASYVQLLERRYKSKLDKDADDFIRFAVEGTRRMQSLINDLLAFSRVGTRGQSPRPVELDEVVGAALDNLANAIERSEAKVEVLRPLPRVIADAGQLGQVFQNLVSNALKFKNGAPRVEVSAVTRGALAEVTVKDNGIGIDPQYFDRVFVIFQRLHTRQEFEGNGIGLAVCKKIIERHGGRIWIESQPGQGAAFKFTLPLDAAKGASHG